jgi:hypothetical protein
MDAMVPSGKIGLGTGPNEESNPLRLRTTRFTLWRYTSAEGIPSQNVATSENLGPGTDRTKFRTS